MKYDLFICHASEDKDEIARPLADLLIKIGYKVWYDEFSLKLGDSLRQEIDKGLANSRYGIVILSQNFFIKKWPQQELDALVSRETIGLTDRPKIILPIWHKVDVEYVAKYSPLLSGRVAVSTSSELDEIVKEISKVVDNVETYFDIERWATAQKTIFPFGIPDHCKWINLDEIINVLKLVAVENLNHTFLPSGGGMDLTGVIKSHEEGCLELNLQGGFSILKPKELHFESFKPYKGISYFRLEADSLEPSGVFNEEEDKSRRYHFREHLLEIEPLEYHNRDYRHYLMEEYDLTGDEKYLNDLKRARLVNRWLGGVFLITAKAGIYNAIGGTYDGRHNNWSKEELKEFHESLISYSETKGWDIDVLPKEITPHANK